MELGHHQVCQPTQVKPQNELHPDCTDRLVSLTNVASCSTSLGVVGLIGQVRGKSNTVVVAMNSMNAIDDRESDVSSRFSSSENDDDDELQSDVDESVSTSEEEDLGYEEYEVVSSYGDQERDNHINSEQIRNKQPTTSGSRCLVGEGKRIKRQKMLVKQSKQVMSIETKSCSNTNIVGGKTDNKEKSRLVVVGDNNNFILLNHQAQANNSKSGQLAECGQMVARDTCWPPHLPLINNTDQHNRSSSNAPPMPPPERATRSTLSSTSSSSLATETSVAVSVATTLASLASDHLRVSSSPAIDTAYINNNNNAPDLVRPQQQQQQYQQNSRQAASGANQQANKLLSEPQVSSDRPNQLQPSVAGEATATEASIASRAVEQRRRFELSGIIYNGDIVHDCKQKQPEEREEQQPATNIGHFGSHNNVNLNVNLVNVNVNNKEGERSAGYRCHSDSNGSQTSSRTGAKQCENVENARGHRVEADGRETGKSERIQMIDQQQQQQRVSPALYHQHQHHKQQQQQLQHKDKLLANNIQHCQQVEGLCREGSTNRATGEQVAGRQPVVAAATSAAAAAAVALATARATTTAGNPSSNASPSPTFMSAPASSSSSSSSSSSCSSLSNSSGSSSGYQSPSAFIVQQQQQQPPHKSLQAQQELLHHHHQQQQQWSTESNLFSTSSSLASHKQQHLEQQQQHHHQQASQLQLSQEQQQQHHQQPLQRQYPPNHPLGNTKHLCSICGDRATGKHYGVYSCEGCKGFFKRTIRKDIVYVCRTNGDCLIDMRQRNRCQYCRYQKCLRQGMKREAVQEEKQRLKMRACAGSVGANNCDNQVESTSNLMIGNHNNNNTNNNHNSISSNGCFQNSTNHLLTNANNPTYGYNHPEQQIHLADIVEAQLNACDRNRNQYSDIHHLNGHHHQHQNGNQSSSHYITNNHQINSNNNNNISPPTSITPVNNYLNTYSQHHHSPLGSNRLPVMRDYSSYYNSTNVTQHEVDHYHQDPPARKYSRIDDMTLKWAAQMQIERLIEWAKSVPKFTELLIDDQITLLKAYWNELIISDIAFKSIDVLKENQTTGLRSLCIARGLYINESQAYKIGLSNMFDRIINELVVKMHDMRVDANELACLRAIILFNPETHGLKTSQPIEEYRGSIYTTLELYCRKNYDNQPNRFGKLLLRLPALRSIGLKCDSMRRCDNNNNNNSHYQLNNDPSPANNGSLSSITSGNGASVASPSNSTATMLGYQMKLLFFDICYEPSTIDSFLRSSLMLR